MKRHPNADCEEVDYAYFAGLLDGEGWIGSAKNYKSGTRQPRIQIGMTDFDTLIWCQDHFGGHIHEMKSKLAKRPAWKWNMSSKAIREYMPNVVPYMITKRQEAIIAIVWAQEYCGTPGIKASNELLEKQEELWKQLTLLKSP